MIDRRVVLTQVLQGRYPTYWRLYRGTRNYGCAISAWIVAACIIIISLPFIIQNYNVVLLLTFGMPCTICA